MKCCSDIPMAVARYRMNFTISDGCHVVDVVVFGHCLDRFFGCSAQEFQRYLKFDEKFYGI